MNERRFVICELPINMAEFFRNTDIQESELYRRIYLAFRLAFCTLTEEFDYAKAVEILVNGESPQAEVDRLSAELSKNHAKLHGEGEKWEEPQCHTCEYKIGYPPKDGWCYMFKYKIPDCQKYIPHKNQPSTAPTREEWLTKLPNPVDYSEWFEWADDFYIWVRSMPIIPKE